MTGKEKNKRMITAVPAAILLLIAAALWYFVPVTEHVTLDLLPGERNIRIALITDLHSCYYGKGQKSLIKMVDKQSPDIVVLSGDIFDDKIPDDNAKAAVLGLVSSYPCFYVTGNHEYWSDRVDEMRSWMSDNGVTVLTGNTVTINIDGVDMDISGVDDPDEMTMSEWTGLIDNAYAGTDPDHLRILVSHRPERTEVYENYGYDLILCGHAHAGQIRIPFLNRGVFAPNQGFMAEYVNGVYELSGGQIMAVSRGLARESTPLPRYFNHPELLIIDIT